jgi:hypothetical protein
VRIVAGADGGIAAALASAAALYQPAGVTGRGRLAGREGRRG